MKTYLLLTLAFTAALSAATPPASAPRAERPPVLLGAARIENGMTRAEVRASFGEPIVLSANFWAYVHLDFLTRPATGYDSMLLKFDGDRVVEIKVCDSKPVLAFVASQQQVQAGRASRTAAK